MTHQKRRRVTTVAGRLWLAVYDGTLKTANTAVTKATVITELSCKRQQATCLYYFFLYSCTLSTNKAYDDNDERLWGKQRQGDWHSITVLLLYATLLISSSSISHEFLITRFQCIFVSPVILNIFVGPRAGFMKPLRLIKAGLSD